MLRPTKIEVYVQSNTRSQEDLSQLFSEALTSLYERRKLHALSHENLDAIYQLSLLPLLTEDGILSPDSRRRDIPYTNTVIYSLGKTLENLDLTIEVNLLPKKSRSPEIYLKIR